MFETLKHIINAVAVLSVPLTRIKNNITIILYVCLLLVRANRIIYYCDRTVEISQENSIVNCPNGNDTVFVLSGDRHVVQSDQRIWLAVVVVYVIYFLMPLRGLPRGFRRTMTAWCVKKKKIFEIH